MLVTANTEVALNIVPKEKKYQHQIKNGNKIFWKKSELQQTAQKNRPWSISHKQNIFQAEKNNLESNPLIPMILKEVYTF